MGRQDELARCMVRPESDQQKAGPWRCAARSKGGNRPENRREKRGGRGGEGGRFASDRASLTVQPQPRLASEGGLNLEAWPMAQPASHILNWNPRAQGKNRHESFYQSLCCWDDSHRSWDISKNFSNFKFKPETNQKIKKNHC